MAIDYTKLLRRLFPEEESDGAGNLTMRVGVVDAVNAGGTVNVAVSGLVVANVPRLAGSNVQAGAVVQILSYRGSMLVIGGVATNTASSGIGLWTRVRSNTSYGGVPTTLVTVLTTPTVTMIRNRVYEIKSHAGVSAGTTGAVAFLKLIRSTGATIGEAYRFPCTISSSVFNGGFSGIYFGVSNAGNVTGSVQLQMSMSSGTGTHYANSDQERNLEIWDVGGIDEFPGISTW